MIDPRLSKLARLLVTYSTEVKQGETVAIRGTTASEPLLREIYREVLRAGAHPLVRMGFPDQEYVFFSNARDLQLDYQDPLGLHEIENIDVAINLFSDLNPHALTSVPAEKKQRRMRARKRLTETFMRRLGEKRMRWVGTLCPSPALAQEARMSLEEYSEFVFACGSLNDGDPVAFWKRYSADQQKTCDRLNAFRAFRYVGLDTDLKFNCEGRRWINCDGRENFPDGEVFTGPVEDSVEGMIRFTYPGIFMGEEIEDIFLRFEKGRVVEARAKKGQELLRKLLDTDEGSSRVGEIAIGTNYAIQRFTKNMLFDEKMGGTVHLAVGAGIPETGNRNVSGLHWDILKDMRDGGEIHADGTVIYRNGRFV